MLAILAKPFSKMSISNLPTEILDHTLEFVSLSNPWHLLLSALVNRSWCAIAIPKLWRNPFGLLVPEERNLRYQYLISSVSMK